ncbi:efflux RND transporter periplasmic adaptor subunit [Vibrio fortis]|uniref:efflux RND transporter periplasmic adaptor subunit n=1 Tax=Vibrio fortis TaxID=212667 RepID=UPI00406883A4
MKLSKLSVVLIMSSLGLVGCSEPSVIEQSQLVRPVKLLQTNQLVTATLRSFPAQVEANQEAGLSFRVSGELVTLPLLEGQVVHQGEVLAKLDSRDEKNNVLLAEADYELSAADFKRRSELLAKKLISKSDYDASKAKLKTAKANLASAKDRLGYTTLTAPFDGIVASRLIDNFQTVQAGQTIITLQRNDLLDVAIQMPESFIQKIHQYLDKGLTPDTYIRFNQVLNQSYPVTFKESATQITPSSQSYKTTFTLIQPEDLTVLPGMSAELYIDFSQLEQSQTIVVPSSAVGVLGTDQNGQETSVVWLFDEESQTVMSKRVTLGKVTAEGIEITSGIDVDDVIVETGIQHLSEGMKVKPLTWQRGV